MNDMIPAEVYADDSCALCDSTGYVEDGSECPHRAVWGGPYLAGVKRATADLFTLVDSVPLETWQECIMVMDAIDDLYRAVAAVKKRALATGTSLARHHKIGGDDGA